MHALKKKIDSVSSTRYGFFLPSNNTEKEMIEKIIFNYYYLIDSDLKEDIFLLHPELSKSDINKVKAVQLKIEEKIFKHYNENKDILGIK